MINSEVSPVTTFNKISLDKGVCLLFNECGSEVFYKENLNCLLRLFLGFLFMYYFIV